MPSHSSAGSASRAGAWASRRSGIIRRAAATALLVLMSPLMLVIGSLIAMTSRAPLLVQVPITDPSGRLAYRTEFRTRPALDVDTHDGPGWESSRLGRFLGWSQLARLPGLLDVRARP